MDGSAALIAFVAVSSLDRAQEFYGTVLGLSLADERPFALVARMGDAMLRITEVESMTSAPYTVLGWRVDDIDAQVDELVSRGVSFTHYDGMAQDGRGVWAAPGGARVAWFPDPDGNNLSLTEFPAGGQDRGGNWPR